MTTCKCGVDGHDEMCITCNNIAMLTRERDEARAAAERLKGPCNRLACVPLDKHLAEVERLKEEVVAADAAFKDSEGVIDRLEAEVERLRDLLWKYGEHHDRCEPSLDPDGICACGFSAVLAEKDGG